ncbi:XRE family transcriptional regulator [Actinokineospora soli]
MAESGDEDLGRPGTSNAVNGNVQGPVVQAANVHAVHFHHTPKVTTTPRQLPPDNGAFVGRAADTAELDEAVEADDPQARTIVISAIHGTAGVGKTTLAVHWSHRVRSRFPDGDLYINMRGYDSGSPVDAGDALDQFLRDLGVTPSDIPADVQAKSGLFRSLMHERRMLVVLDNVADVAQVEPILPGSGESFVLITSRNRLDALHSRYLVRRVSLDLLSHDESIALLRKVLGSEVVDREPAAASTLVELAARLPLAIRIVAEAARGRPRGALADLVDELEHSGSTMDDFVSEDESVRLSAVFDHSYALLQERDAVLFRRLGVHPGARFSVHAAAVLVGGDVTETRRGLRRLAANHLVEEGDDRRFTFHDLLRVYARHRSAADDPAEVADAAFRRLATWYLTSATQASVILMPQRSLKATADDVAGMVFASYDQALDWCELEREEIRAVVQESAARGLHDHAWKLPVAMRGFYNLRKHWKDWIVTHEIGEQAARSVDDGYGRSRVLNGIGTVLQQTGKVADAVAYHREAAELALAAEDVVGATSALDSLGHAHRRQRQFAQAAGCFRRSLELRTEREDTYGQAWSWNNLGELAVAEGKLDEGHRYLSRALELRIEVDDKWGQGRTLHGLGECEVAAQRPDVALARFADAVRLRKSIGDAWGAAASLECLGDVRASTGDADGAVAAWQEALPMLESVADLGAPRVRAKIASYSDPAPGGS